METFFSALWLVGGILIGLLLLVFLVVIHELGHAIAARRNGVDVEEFGIGFPPQAWATKLKNGVLFTLNWLPLGGFVKLKGEHDSATQKGSFGAAPLKAKAKILMAGVAVNFVGAMVIFAILALIGIPKVLPGQFSVPSDTQSIREPVIAAEVVDGQPAQKAGIKKGDLILKINNEPVDTAEELVALTRENAGKTITFVYERDGQTKSTQVRLNPKNDQNQGYLGIGPGQREFIRATWSAPAVGVVTTFQFTYETFKGLGGLFYNLGVGIASKFSGDEQVRKEGDEKLGEANQGVAGPIGILGVLFPNAVSAGPQILLFLTGIISLTLAVMNALPIPALDGGRLFVTLLFRAMRRPLSKEREESIHATGFLVLMGLIVFITVLDVGKLTQR